MAGHPVNRKADKSHIVPLRLHGDGVPVGKGKTKSTDILSLSSMSGAPGCTWDTKILMFALLTDTKAAEDQSGPSTMQLVWRIIVWSFEVCMTGKWPAFDWNGESFEHKDPARWQRAGQNLCGEYTLAVFQVAADWIIFAITCRYAIF